MFNFIELPDIEPLRLNNNANFDSLQNNDDYDNDEYFKHPNFMHEIINQNDYSNNITPNHLKETSGPNSQSSSSSNSSHDDEVSRSHHHKNNDDLPATYLPPASSNNENTLPHAQNFPPANSFANIPNQNSSNSAASDVNPFFSQHPFFKKQLEQHDTLPNGSSSNT